MGQGVVIDPNTSSTLYAATDGGLFKSMDSSNTWSVTDLTSPDIKALAIESTTPSTLYVGTGVVVNPYAYYGGALKSTDGRDADTGLASDGVWALAIDPTTPGTLYAGTYDYGVYKSTDGGNTWSGTAGGGYPPRCGRGWLVHCVWRRQTFVFQLHIAEVGPLAPRDMVRVAIPHGLHWRLDGLGHFHLLHGTPYPRLELRSPEHSACRRVPGVQREPPKSRSENSR